MDKINLLSDNLLEAMNIIAENAKSSIHYDQTVIATIVNDSDRFSGKYEVETDTQHFTAVVQANDTSRYMKQDKVYVLIPQGDYNNDKIILGGVVENTDLFEYITPTDQLYDMIDGPSLMGADTAYLTNQQKKVFLGSWSDKNMINSAFFDKFGFSVVIKTTGELPEDMIDYGIDFEISYQGEAAGSTHLIFNAQSHMIGNVYRFILPSRQEIIFDNYNHKAISAIKATAYWAPILDEVQDSQWQIQISDLRFYSGFGLGNRSQDIYKLYSLGDNYYYQSGQVKTVNLIHLTYKDKWEVADVPENIIWQKSLRPLNIDDLSTDAYWVNIGDTTSDSKLVKMDITLPTTQVRAILPDGKIVDYIEYLNKGQMQAYQSEELPQIQFSFPVDYSQGQYLFYNQDNTIIAENDVNVVRRIEPQIDGVELTDDSLVMWEYSTNSMMNIVPPENEYQQYLDFTVKSKYTKGLDNTIKCIIVNQGLMYTGQITCEFGYPTWMTSACTLEVIGAPRYLDMTKHGIDNETYKYEMQARVFDRDGVNRTDKLLAPVIWELDGYRHKITIINQDTQIKYDPIYGSYYGATLQAYVDGDSLMVGNLKIIVSGKWQDNSDVVSYISVPFSPEGQCSAVDGPKYLTKVNGTVQYTQDSPANKYVIYDDIGRPTSQIELSIEGIPAEKVEVKNSELLVHSSDIMAGIQYSLIGRQNGNVVWQEPFYVLDNRAPIGQTSTLVSTKIDELENKAIYISNATSKVIGMISQADAPYKVGGRSGEETPPKDNSLRIASSDDVYIDCSYQSDGAYHGKFYVNGSVVLDAANTTTSDRNQKHDIDYDYEQYEKLFKELRPATFKYNNGTSDRRHLGFIAQDIKESLDNNDISTQEFAGYCEDANGCSLRYDEFVSLNTAMIQQLLRRVEMLENKLKEYERKESE